MWTSSFMNCAKLKQGRWIYLVGVLLGAILVTLRYPSGQNAIRMSLNHIRLQLVPNPVDTKPERTKSRTNSRIFKRISALTVTPAASHEESDRRPGKRRFVRKFDGVVGDNLGKDEVMQKKIFYNRIPKTGSRTLMEAILQATKKNHRKFVRIPLMIEYRDLFDFDAESLMNKVGRSQDFSITEHHVPFIDFTKHGGKQPYYINVMREPFERLASHYYFVRGMIRKRKSYDVMERKRVRMSLGACAEQKHDDCMDPKMYNLQVHILCGEDPICKTPSRASLTRAIFNVNHRYTLVGYTARLQEFAELLEKVFPRTLAGVHKAYIDTVEISRRKYITKIKQKRAESESYGTARAIMMPYMKYEYELYKYVKVKFAQTYQAITKRPLADKPTT